MFNHKGAQSNILKVTQRKD